MTELRIIRPGEVLHAAPTTLPNEAVWVDRKRQQVFASTSASVLLQHATDSGDVGSVDTGMLGRFFAHGAVGCPHTVLTDFLHLGPGDSVLVEDDSDDIRIRNVHAFPFLEFPSTGEPGTVDGLLGRLTAVIRAQTEGRSVLLALSGGKDSLGMALAVAALSLRNLHAVTFASDKDDPDAVLAARYASQLGLRHELIYAPAPCDLWEALVRSCRAWYVPASDTSLLSYVALLANANSDGAVLLDGTGNDTTFGIVPSRADRIKLAAQALPSSVRRLLDKHLKAGSSVRLLARPHGKALFPGHFLSSEEIDQILPDSCPWPAEERLLVSPALPDQDPFLQKQIMIGRLFDPHFAAMKARLAAAGAGLPVEFPWAHSSLVAFITSLPRDQRIDIRGLRNKLLLRQLLENRLGYDAEAVGKISFKHPANTFHQEMATAVLAEIGDCSYWSGRVRERVVNTAREIQRDLDRFPRRVNALQALLCFALWWNRSRYSPRQRRSRLVERK